MLSAVPPGDLVRVGRWSGTVARVSLTAEQDQLAVSLIRGMAMDGPLAANSGHQGTAMALAPLGHVLYSRVLRHDPADPAWPDRDRFVLSNGHASILQYTLLFLSGYGLELDDLRQFRQWESATPGHPEAGHTAGVEVTTGPLGQGLAHAVGMALAERYLAARYGDQIVDHHTYVLASDGDMMEGISHEAASMAGHLKLGKLVVLYDSNDISLEGPTAEWFTDDTAARFRACGWHVCQVDDANSDYDAIAAAIEEARAEVGKPSLVICRTSIGFGSPLQDTSAAHGKPLDDEQVKATKRTLGWPEDEKFLVPDRARDYFLTVAERGKTAREAWESAWATYAEAQPEKAEEWRRALADELPEGWDAELPTWTAEDKPVSTRVAAGDVLEALRQSCPRLIGGCADLASSTRTMPKDKLSMMPGDYGHQNIRFAVREHLMAAACNGIVRHGGLRAYGSTFLVFSDYARPSLRLAGLMKTGVVYQFTHDSIGVGEDGPTHQPVEHLAALRCVPNLTVIRPADANEAREAWRAAMLQADGPTALACSRQNLPVLDRTKLAPAEGLHKGAYVLSDPAEGEPEIILMATGSEVAPTLEAAGQLTDAGRRVRVVSFPSWELFERQPEDYRLSVLPPTVRRRIAVEAGLPMGWDRYVGDEGEVIGLPHFGESGPGGQVMKKLGFSAENIVARAQTMLGS